MYKSKILQTSVLILGTLVASQTESMASICVCATEGDLHPGRGLVPICVWESSEGMDKPTCRKNCASLPHTPTLSAMELSEIAGITCQGLFPL